MLKRKTQLHVSARGHLQVGSFWIFREKNAVGNVLLICNDGGGGGGTEISFYKEWGVYGGVLGVSKFWCSSASMVSSGSVVRPVVEGWSLRVWVHLVICTVTYCLSLGSD
jgi:hypothetical protein